MITALASALAISSCFAPHADWMALQSGTGDQVEVSGLGWEYPLVSECTRNDRLRGGMLFRADGWRGRNEGGSQVLDLSATPFMRYEMGRPLHIPVYFETGIGAHILSHTRVDDQRQFSTAYQFGEFIGFAVRYGDHNESQAGIRLQHVSNGHIKEPNDGLTYAMLYFNHRF